jgi:putative sugar O-methyltransferase
VVSKSNGFGIKQMLQVYDDESVVGEKGKSLRWLQNSLPWHHLHLESELPNFRKKMSGSFDGNFSESTVKEKLTKIESVVPLSTLIELSESLIGNPVSFKLLTKSGEEVCVDGNDLSLIYFANRISAHWQTTHQNPPTRILDIGGGYGGLVGKLAKVFPSARISLIDTPEGNLLQSFYLHELFPNAELGIEKYWTETLSFFDARFSIIPIRKFSLLFNFEWDLIINTRSMQEMDQEDISLYFELIQKKLCTGGIFYNANQLVGGSAGIPYHISRSPYDKKWSLLSASPSFIQDDNFEICALRLGFDNNLFLKYLATLPTNNIWRTGLWSYRHKALMLLDQLGASYMPRVWLPLKKTTRYWRKKSMKRKYKKTQL